MTVPFLLAARIARTTHVRGAAVATGLALVPLIVILIVADGMIEGITARYVELGTYHARAYLPEDADALEAAEAARGVPGVTGAYLELQGEGLLRSAGGAVAVRLRCVDPSLGDEPGFARYLALPAGSFDLGAPGSAVLGEHTAATLGVGVGEEVQLATLASVGRATIPRLSRLRVTGVFSTGYQELDRNWVFLSARDGERLLPAGRRDRFLGVKILDPYGERQGTLGKLRAALPDARVYDWYQLESNQFRSFEVTRNLLVFIMALVVLVGGVNVSSAVLMVVLERKQEIGILKSMGASPGTVRFTFLLVGLMVGIAGSLGGMIVGLVVGIHVNELFAAVESVVNGVQSVLAWSRSVGSGATVASPFRILGSGYYLERIPVHVGVGDLLAAAAATIALSSLAAWLPARRAARLRPLEVIRRQ